ncbi:MAG: hypothetical protein SF053_03070 [Bacteroidia bacterium]|nr:hypothetical protein [Bacteroidia bacterium]
MSSSLDPRINRLDLPAGTSEIHQELLDHWQNYEVFQQQKRGDQHVHVGAIHAPNPEMALILAKEQFGRREQCANLWVVRSQDVYATAYEDDDMFQHAFDKSYREGNGYKVRDTIESFKARLYELIDNGRHTPAAQPAPVTEAPLTPAPVPPAHVIVLPPGADNKPRKIILRK